MTDVDHKKPNMMQVSSDIVAALDVLLLRVEQPQKIGIQTKSMHATDPWNKCTVGGLWRTRMEEIC